MARVVSKYRPTFKKKPRQQNGKDSTTVTREIWTSKNRACSIMSYALRCSKGVLK